MIEVNETITVIRSHIENLIQTRLHESGNRYLLKDFSIDDNCNVIVDMQNITWNNITDVKKSTTEYLNYSLVLGLSFVGNISIFVNDSLTEFKPDINFNFEIDTWFRIQDERTEFSVRIMDSVLKKTKDYVSEIEHVCENKQIYCLFDDKIVISGKNALSFAIDITRKPQLIETKIHDFNTVDDIFRASQEIKLLFGEVLLLNPYITNYTSNPVPFNGTIIYTYFPTFIDQRFFQITGLLFESLYNYWDKIGDIIAVYLTPNLSPTQIYFPTAIDNIPVEFHPSNNYKWLKDFKRNEYNQLNKKRKSVVHYKHLESNFHEEYSKNFNNKAELETLFKEKMELSVFLDDQVRKTITGFEKAFGLIDEIK